MTTPISSALREALEGATPGPWRFDSDPCNYDPEQEAPWLLGTAYSGPNRSPSNRTVIGGECKIENPRDRDLILLLANNLPAIVAAVELAEAVDAAEGGGWLDLSRGSTLRCDGALSSYRTAAGRAS